MWQNLSYQPVSLRSLQLQALSMKPWQHFKLAGTVRSQTPPQHFLHNDCCPVSCMNHHGRNRAIKRYFKGWILFSSQFTRWRWRSTIITKWNLELVLKLLSGQGCLSSLLHFKCSLSEHASQLNSSTHTQMSNNNFSFNVFFFPQDSY